MDILDVSIILFVMMESANVCILYFAPDSKLGNGVAVFNGFSAAKQDENTNLFVSYMINWVAGAKLIFIALLLVILLTGNEATKFGSVVVMIFSIFTYFFRLHPIISKLDENDEITPKGYSRTLYNMILGFIMMFGCALVVYIYSQFI